MRRNICILFIHLCLASFASAQVYFAPKPGPARAQVAGEALSISNAILQVSWRTAGGRLRGAEVRDLLNHRVLDAPSSPLVLILKDGRMLSLADMRLTNSPKATEIAAQPHASRAAARIGGSALVVEAEDPVTALHVTWRAVLRDGSNYVRQEITLTAASTDVAISEVRLLDWNLPGARVVGTVKGSPIVAGDLFAGFEHPLSRCFVGAGRARCTLERELPLKAGRSVTYSSVIGVTSPGQLRRGFLYYMERERAHPYRTFLHYNSWYDLGYFSKFDEAGALDRVNAFGAALNKKRGVVLSSYLFDDGWDAPATLWKFNSGFPDGFASVRRAAASYGAGPGVWMSPWGGYGKPRQERVSAARAAGYEVVDNGFALSGPKYYRLFRDTCLDMMRRYGVNQFKFDGTGNANRVVPGSEFDSDFDAAINLIGELRAEKPDLYVNLTTGTYASPFWLRYADSIWRGGEDHSFAGVGTSRERWITYRDADTYAGVVLGGPLYPLNSLMLHGLIYARYAKGLDTDPGHDFRNEIRDYFGSGTQLQEMYITPALLSAADWDDLAEAANWSRVNADVLVDTHWIGGDPAELEVYGWASWSPRKGILVLRNPSDRPQTIAIALASAFELPPAAPRAYRVHSPWIADAGLPPLVLHAGTPHLFELKPFQVLVLDALPAGK
jgi:hypothetical protein